MGSATFRPYRDDGDYLRMRRFLQAGWQVTGIDGGLYHVGDLTWQRFMYTPDVFAAEELIGLWERPDGGGNLIGFTLFSPKWREVAIQIDPRLCGTDAWDEIAGEMLVWAEERHAALPNLKNLNLSTWGPVTDVALVRFAAAHGFARSDDPPMRFHRRALADPIPEPALPAGFSVRAVRDEEAQIADRVAIHQEVWAPSRVTIESYRRLRGVPGYDPELDIVAVAPDGVIAAYAICWHDEVNRHGLFEPVGAREAYRGRGLARAVLSEGMRRLRERGCEQVFVFTGEDRIPACRLYRSAGFEIINRWVGYARPSS